MYTEGLKDRDDWRRDAENESAGGKLGPEIKGAREEKRRGRWETFESWEICRGKKDRSGRAGKRMGKGSNQREKWCAKG